MKFTADCTLPTYEFVNAKPSLEQRKKIYLEGLVFLNKLYNLEMNLFHDSNKIKIINLLRDHLQLINPAVGLREAKDTYDYFTSY